MQALDDFRLTVMCGTTGDELISQTEDGSLATAVCQLKVWTYIQCGCDQV